MKKSGHISRACLFRAPAIMVAALIALAAFTSCSGGLRAATDTDDKTPGYSVSAKEAEEIAANRGDSDFNIAINTVLWFKKPTSAAESGIGNISSNIYDMSVEIFADDGGARLYSSETVGRGKELGEIKLAEELPEGSHAATAVFSALDPKDGSVIGKTAAAVTVTVGGDKPADLLRMSVTVPVRVRLYVQADGSVNTTEGNDIINHSSHPVYVSDIAVAAEDYEIIPIEDAYSAKKGKKKLGVQVYGVNWLGDAEKNGMPNWSKVDRQYYGAIPGTLLFPEEGDVALESRLQSVPIFAVSAPTSDGKEHELVIGTMYRICIDTEAKDFINSAVGFDDV